MKKGEKILLFITILLSSLIIYSIHFNYNFPIHGDEWIHISEATKISEGTYTPHIEIGFHIFLYTLSFLMDLILYYKFLPTLWFILSSLTLFFLVYKKSDNNYWLALLSIIFFASIKSNNNLTGISFFTPLTFSIPFIFMYIYFLTEGLERNNKKYILISLLIMLFILPFHAISVLFSIPSILIYSLIFHLKLIKKEWKFFSFFILIPILGLLFYSSISNLSLTDTNDLLEKIIFSKGWGVNERDNSFFETYSLTGYILSAIGIIISIINKNKKYYFFIISIFTLFISITIFKIYGISPLSPFQRNLYYMTLMLPILSSYGLYTLIKLIKNNFNKKLFIIITIILLIFTLIFTFKDYYKPYQDGQLIKYIEKEDYLALYYLKDYPKGKVLTEDRVQMTVYPLSLKKPVTETLTKIDEKRIDAIRFYMLENCKDMNDILLKYDIKYVVSKEQIDCNWKEIYNENNRTIYKINKN
jgi:hypothetical protein